MSARLSIGLVGAIALIAASGPAQAQSWSGLAGVERESGTRRAYQGLADFAECIVKYQRDDVRAFLLMSESEAIRRDAMRELARENADCMRSLAMRLTSSYFRGALVEELYRREFDGPADGAASVRLPEPGDWLDVAQCVAAGDRAGSDALVRTSIASPQQQEAIERLGPLIQRCVSGSGASVPSVPELLRFRIAEALYRSAPVRQEAAE